MVNTLRQAPRGRVFLFREANTQRDTAQSIARSTAFGAKGVETVRGMETCIQFDIHICRIYDRVISRR